MYSCGSFEMCHSHRLSSLVSFVSSGFDKERRKDLATGRANTQCVNLQQKTNRVEAVSSCDISKDSAHNLLFCQQSCDGSLCPLWRMCPLSIAITPLLLLWPSICVMSKRPHQCCWCHSTKCTLPLSISEDLGSSIKNTCQTAPCCVVIVVFVWPLPWERCFPVPVPETTRNVTILPFLARRVHDHLSGDITRNMWWRLLPKTISGKNKVVFKTARAATPFVMFMRKTGEVQASGNLRGEKKQVR